MIEQGLVTYDPQVKFDLYLLWLLKFSWDRARPICFCIVKGCFDITAAELGSCDSVLMAAKDENNAIGLFKEKVCWPLV